MIDERQRSSDSLLTLNCAGIIKRINKDVELLDPDSQPKNRDFVFIDLSTYSLEKAACLGPVTVTS